MGNIYVNEDLMKDVADVLEAIGLDVDTVVRMTLKRVVREGGISFLVTGVNTKIESEQIQQKEPNEVSGRINKYGAMARFREQGHEIGKNATFASKNRAAHNYWANPTFDVLEQDWYLILNDWMKEEIHLFKIPANSLTSYDLVCRNDRPERIDLQICYEDNSFTDNRSKVSFWKFHVASIRY